MKEKLLRILNRFLVFYLIFYFVALLFGNIDFYVVCKKDINDRGNPPLCIPKPISLMDGGTRYWCGIGYYIVRSNELHSTRVSEEEQTSDILGGWKLRPWPVFALPILGNSLFKREKLTYYYDLSDPFDLKSAKETWKDKSSADERYLEDIFWSIAFIVTLLVFLLKEGLVFLLSFYINRRSNQSIESTQ